MTNGFSEFISKFKFRPELLGFVGIEREQFLVSRVDGRCVPMSPQFIKLIRNKAWTYEFSACQVESRTPPLRDMSAIKLALLRNENLGQKLAGKIGLRLATIEVAEEDMPLDIYPEPRYLEIARTISSNRQLKAAFRVTGAHVHLGTRDINHAIAVNNLLVPHLKNLCKIGDHSNGERLQLYKTMAKNWRPMRYHNPEHLFQVAQNEGFVGNPRNCWKLIRISVHGTVELRMFGATENIDEILEWVGLIKSLTKEIL